MSITRDNIDFDAHYTVERYGGGIAFWLAGWVKETTYEGDILVCEDEDCDHDLSEMCWAEGDWSLTESDTMVEAVMVGDDIVHHVDIDELTMIDDDDYCHQCGQVGCTHDGRERA